MNSVKNVEFSSEGRTVGQITVPSGWAKILEAAGFINAITVI